MTSLLPPGYQFHAGSTLDRAMLVKFMQRTYEELYPEQDFSHLAATVDRYFSPETPLWWIEWWDGDAPSPQEKHDKVACLWLGNAVDQVQGDRYAHIFLLYVAPEHRRQGIGKALMDRAENWARARGDRQIGLQVFATNQPAVNLYHQLGYTTQSLVMFKLLRLQNSLS